MDSEALSANLAREEAARREVGLGSACSRCVPAAPTAPAGCAAHCICCRSAGCSLVLDFFPSWVLLQDREAHDAALREVQRELGSMGQDMKRREAELATQQAEVRAGGSWKDWTCRPRSGCP